MMPVPFAPRYIAKSPRCIYKPLVVARTGEDLHDYVLFADGILASEAHSGCLCRLLRAFSDSIDRADIPIPNSLISLATLVFSFFAAVRHRMESACA